jgi:hypothetical protein
MSEESKKRARQRKIDRRPEPYHAALSVVRRDNGTATKKDRALYEYALGASDFWVNHRLSHTCPSSTAHSILHVV